MSTKDMTVIPLFAALIAVLSQISLPLSFSPVPITLQSLGIFLTGGILGSKRGFLSVLLYIFMGLFGLPVFSMGKAGLPVIVGPTGGYILGFMPAVYIIGKILEDMAKVTWLKSILAMAAGCLMIYILGTPQLMLVLNIGFREALVLGVLPYIIFELVKIMLGSYLSYKVGQALFHIWWEPGS